MWSPCLYSCHDIPLFLSEHGCLEHEETISVHLHKPLDFLIQASALQWFFNFLRDH